MNYSQVGWDLFIELQHIQKYPEFLQAWRPKDHNVWLLIRINELIFEKKMDKKHERRQAVEE